MFLFSVVYNECHFAKALCSYMAPHFIFWMALTGPIKMINRDNVLGVLKKVQGIIRQLPWGEA